MNTITQIWEAVGWIVYAGLFGSIGALLGARYGYREAHREFHRIQHLGGRS